MDYYVEMLAEEAPVLGFVVTGAKNPKEAEEVALRKYPENPLNQEPWGDVEVYITEHMNEDWLARCLRVAK